MKDSARYAKIVEWSEEDHCYLGCAPGLLCGETHGNNEKAVFEELCQIVEEAVDLYRKEGTPLPPPTSGRDYANRMQKAAWTTPTTLHICRLSPDPMDTRRDIA